MHQSSYQRMAEFAGLVRDRFRGRPVRVLDIGSKGVNGTYKELFSFAGVEYVGLDMEPGPNVDIVPNDLYNWRELPDGGFDVIVSGQTLEHCEYPWQTLRQIARTLKPGGLACLIAPSRGPEHRFPTDCYRYYPDGLRALAKWAGLTVVEADYVRGSSGFQDGSDQWGDCWCIATKAAAPPPAHDAQPQFVPIATPADPTATPPKRLHQASPLAQGPTHGYYGMERRDVLQAIERMGLQARHVLELGCASGKTGARIKELLRVERYVGIELSPEAAEMARCRLDAVHCADLERADTAALGLVPGEFDLLLALDVLEHLYDPWETMAKYAALLRPGGTAVVSIPNVANIAVLGELMNGTWSYVSAGILDATHLRFFTSSTMHPLLAGANLLPYDVTIVLNPKIDVAALKDEGNSLRVGKMHLADLTRDEVLRLCTYQYIITSRKTNPEPAVPPPKSLDLFAGTRAPSENAAPTPHTSPER